MTNQSRLANTGLELRENECARQKQKQFTFPMRIMRNLFQDSVPVNQATIAYFTRYRLTVDKNLVSVPLERANPKE